MDEASPEVNYSGAYADNDGSFTSSFQFVFYHFLCKADSHNSYRNNQNKHNHEHGNIGNDRHHFVGISGRHFIDGSLQRACGIYPPVSRIGIKGKCKRYKAASNTVELSDDFGKSGKHNQAYCKGQIPLQKCNRTRR